MRIRNEHLEHVKSFVLDHFPVVSEKIHAYFQVLAAVDVRRHDAVVGPVQQKFAKEFDRLSFGDIAVRLHQSIVVFIKEEVEVCGEIFRNQVFVSCQELLFHS